MQHQSSTPGPEFGWAFGGLGFVVTIVLGWLIDVGVGFVLVAVVFWGGIGALFAFLVERSTIEEHDRVEELQNTRLATLAPAWVPQPAPRARREERTPTAAGRPRTTDAPQTVGVGGSSEGAVETARAPRTAVAGQGADAGRGGREGRDAAAAAILAGRTSAIAAPRDDDRAAAAARAPTGSGAAAATAPTGNMRQVVSTDAGASERDPGRWNGARVGAARAAGASAPRSSATPAPGPARWNGARMAASRNGDRDARSTGPAGRGGASTSSAGRPGARPGEPARPSAAAPRPSERERRPAHPRRPESDASSPPQPRSPREYREARAARDDGAHEDHAAA